MSSEQVKKKSNSKSKSKPKTKPNSNSKSKSKATKQKKKPVAEKGLPPFGEFSEWFNQVLIDADIIDYRYNLKGCGVWLPYGFKIRQYAFQIIRDLLDSTPVPHDEMLFPLLIPEPQFMKEKETVKGFEDEVYWVKDGGTKPLDVKLALRPTSETAMYPMASIWIRSHQDLPLKTYQIANMFRYEGKNTRPLIRVREITTFKEAHTYHATADECEDQIREAIGCYKGFFDALGVPYLVTQRPKWDTFPGANYTIAFDCIFPINHKALQIGTVHNLGQVFAKTFDIKYETVDGKQEYVHQTCYGISERAIAALIASHGDDKGLKIPPRVAPIEAVIVPILFKNKEQIVLDVCNSMFKTLKEAGLKVRLDTRTISPGRKYFHWELKGIPLRIEIGPRDVEKGNVCLVRRDTGEKAFIPQTEAVDKIKSLLQDIQKNLWDSAKENHQKWILRTNDLEEALEYIDAGNGVADIPFCGSEECAAPIEQRLENLKFLGIPEEYIPALNKSVKVEKDIYCAYCSKPVSQYWRVGRSY
ncbi:MAG: proline--tRNA ligase [Promethearchaeota archaeon]